MTFRKFATGAALAIAGLMAAVGIGLLANSISGDNVGLGAEPLSAGETLAPASAKKADERSQKRTRTRRRNRNRGGNDGKPADTVTVPPSSGTGGTVTTFDDHGGTSGGSGSDDGGGPRARPAQAAPAAQRLRLDPGRLRLGRLERLRQLGRLGRLEPLRRLGRRLAPPAGRQSAPGEGVQTGAGTEIRH